MRRDLCVPCRVSIATRSAQRVSPRKSLSEHPCGTHQREQGRESSVKL